MQGLEIAGAFFVEATDRDDEGVVPGCVGGIGLGEVYGERWRGGGETAGFQRVMKVPILSHVGGERGYRGDGWWGAVFNGAVMV